MTRTPYALDHSLISILYPRLDGLKTIPYTAAHTHWHLGYMWEYSPRGSLLLLPSGSGDVPCFPRRKLVVRVLDPVYKGLSWCRKTCDGIAYHTGGSSDAHLIISLCQGTRRC